MSNETPKIITENVSKKTVNGTSYFLQPDGTFRSKDNVLLKENVTPPTVINSVNYSQRELQYNYPSWCVTPDQRQSYRAKMRRQKTNEYLYKAGLRKPRGPKLTEAQRLANKKSRRERRKNNANKFWDLAARSIGVSRDELKAHPEKYEKQVSELYAKFEQS